MIRNYFKIAWRNLIKNRVYSLINIGGLAVGMGVAILISLWVYDEVSYDQYHANYERIAQVLQHQTYNGETGTQEANPAVMGEEIRSGDSVRSKFQHERHALLDHGYWWFRS